MAWHSTKRSLMRPVTAVRRRRARRLGPINRAVFEAQGYRPAMVQFFHAARRDPEILVDAVLPPGAVVLDLGAYEGEWSRRVLSFADRRGQSDVHIHAFEPEPGAVDRCHHTLGDEARVSVHPFGLAGRDARITLEVRGPGSSVFHADGAPNPLGRTEVEVRDVHEVLAELGTERIDLVKINIEGGEYEVIERLHETGWLPRIGAIIVQFHEIVPGARRLRRRSGRQLSDTHRRTWSYPWVYERWDPR